MNRDRIDSISQISLDTVTLPELRWMYGTGIAISKGSGRNKTYTYRNGAATEIGDVRDDVWYQAVEHIAQRDQEVWVVDALALWEQEHDYCQRTLAGWRKEALQLYASQLWKDPEWVCFIPFCRKHCPEILAQVRLVTVINACCGKPGEVTQEQIDRACQGTIHCPHCGRWSEFTILSREEVAPWEVCDINSNAQKGV